MDRFGGMSSLVFALAMGIVVLALALQNPAGTASDVGFWGLVGTAVALAIVSAYQRFAEPGVGRTAAPVIGKIERFSQRLMASEDEEGIIALATAELSGLLATPRTTLVPRREGHLVIDQGTSRLTIDPGHERSFIRAVAQTGRTISTITDGGAAGRPVALLGVPTVDGPRSLGVLVAVRDADHPFTMTEQHVSARLGPIVGAALQQARTKARGAGAASRDQLTRLADRRRFRYDLSSLLHDRRAEDTVLALIDIDHFTELAAAPAGSVSDQLLVAVADVIRAEIRPADTAYRYSDDGFCVLLRDIRSDAAVRTLDRIRERVAHIFISHAADAADISATVSIGITYVSPADPLRSITTAHAALHEARRRGRNCVVLASDSPFGPPTGTVVASVRES